MNGIPLAECKSLLGDLVGFPSVTGTPIMPIARFIASYLDRHGIAYRIEPDASGERANIFATIGPERDGGVILSGHLDVVKADEGGWTGDPFTLREIDGKLIGRGAVDMKGFVAMALTVAAKARKMALRRPLHLAFTFDEETGCFGAKQMQPMLEALPYKPSACIVGEATEMRPVVAHRALIETEFVVRGRSAHALDPRQGVNAVYAACRVVTFIEELAARLASRPRTDTPFDPPYTTLNLGTIEGGLSRNTVPWVAWAEWEVRPLPDEDGLAVVDEVEKFMTDVLRPQLQAQHAEADIWMSEVVETRALHSETGSPALALVQKLVAGAQPGVKSFGTDAGYFQAAGISTVVFGPGNLDSAHGPDEFIRSCELAEGLEFLHQLCHHLTETPAET